jgi:hypothetical protein
MTTEEIDNEFKNHYDKVLILFEVNKAINEQKPSKN